MVQGIGESLGSPVSPEHMNFKNNFERQNIIPDFFITEILISKEILQKNNPSQIRENQTLVEL